MNQAEITAAARRLMGEPYARRIVNTDIVTATLDAVNVLAHTLVRAEKEYFITRKSLQAANGYRFSIPAASHSILRVWDMGTNAITITGAADNGATLVRITAASHGFVTDDVVTIHDIVGTIEGNGRWKITKITDNTFDLRGSTYANVYTSGGKAFKESNANHCLLRRQTNTEQGSSSELRYFLEEAYLIVDYPLFDNDLIVTYYIIPSALAEIPERFHLGIPGYICMTLIELPQQEDPQFLSLQYKLKIADNLWTTCLDLAKGFRPVTESKNISESSKVRRWI